MELTAQLVRRHRTLDLQWRSRDENEEADALTNERFEGFDPARRIDATGVLPRLECLQRLAARLPEFTTALEEMRGAPKASARRARWPRGDLTLRQREPW